MPINLDKRIAMSKLEKAEPIVENPKRKPMDSGTVRPRKIAGKTLLMAKTVKPSPPSASGRGKKMDPVPARRGRGAAKPDGDQEERGKEGVTVTAEKSVRLRLRVDQGEVSVIGARTVPGPTPAPEQLHYGLAFEVTHGGRQLAVGSVPDVGEMRSFPPPKPEPGQEGHYVAPLDSFEVEVRVPQKEFTAAVLPRLQVTLLRMKAEPPQRPISAAPLAEQFRDELRPVAELKGIRLNALPTGVRGELTRALAPRRRRR